MNNKNLLIGAGVVVVAYLLWKKSQNNSVNKSNIKVPENALVRPFVNNTSSSTNSEKKKEAQSYLDMINEIVTDLNKNSTQEKRNGILYQIDKNGKDIGFWNGDNFIRTDGKDKLMEQYKKNIKDLGFTFLNNKVLTQSEYEIELSKMF